MLILRCYYSYLLQWPSLRCTVTMKYKTAGWWYRERFVTLLYKQGGPYIMLGLHSLAQQCTVCTVRTQQCAVNAQHSAASTASAVAAQTNNNNKQRQTERKTTLHNWKRNEASQQGKTCQQFSVETKNSP